MTDLEAIRARHHGANPGSVFYSFISPEETSELFEEVGRLQAELAATREVIAAARVLRATFGGDDIPAVRSGVRGFDGALARLEEIQK